MEPELLRALKKRWPKLQPTILAAVRGDPDAQAYLNEYIVYLDKPRESEGGEDAYLVDAAEARALSTVEF